VSQLLSKIILPERELALTVSALIVVSLCCRANSSLKRGMRWCKFFRTSQLTNNCGMAHGETHNLRKTREKQEQHNCRSKKLRDNGPAGCERLPCDAGYHQHAFRVVGLVLSNFLRWKFCSNRV
jgi:hypothetical protein